MPEKRQWTEQQDKVLRELFQVKKIAKWSTIAQKMADQYHMPGRNGKQCRQRYQSVLQPSFFHLQWTQQQEKLMYALHDEVGNKWAQIAQRMPGRTDNCVKNHFYSNLRKAIRKLNKAISQHFKPMLKQVRPIVLYKIIEATDKDLKIEQPLRDQISLNCRKIKNKLLAFSIQNSQLQQDVEFLKQLAVQIQNFSKDYKRKPKKDRRGVAQSMNLMKVPKIDKFKCASDIEQQPSQFDSIQVSQQNSIQIGQRQQQKQRRQRVYRPKIKEVIQVSNSCLKESENKVQEQQPNQNKGIQLFLKNKGLSLHDNPQIPLNNGVGLFSNINIANSLNQSINQPFYFKSISESINSDIRDRMNGANFSAQNFHLGQSIDKPFKCSFILRQSGEIDEELKLFKSTG